MVNDILNTTKHYIEQIISYFNNLFKNDAMPELVDYDRKSFDIWLPKNDDPPIFDREYNLLF